MVHEAYGKAKDTALNKNGAGGPRNSVRHSIVFFAIERGQDAPESLIVLNKKGPALPSGAFSLCAKHVRELGGESPLPSLMETKG